MYIVEWIIKKLTRKKHEEELFFDTDGTNDGEVVNDYENCEHLFMPIDSTNETLACAKCGVVAKRSELKNKNFFES